MKRRLLSLVLVLFGVALPVLFFSFQEVTAYSMTWKDALAWQIPWWYIWLPLFKVIQMLARRFPFERQRWHRPVLIHLLAAELITLAHTLFTTIVRFALPPPSYQKMHYTFFALFKENVSDTNMQLGMFTYALLVSIACSLDYYQRFQERQTVTSHLHAQLAQTQFQTMKMQLHPEFLFSTLRSISTLMGKNLEAADSLVARLGDFLRLTLEDMKHEKVTLERELLFLQCYLDIEQIRRQEDLSVTMEIEPQALDAHVPNMILQPLMENAVGQSAMNNVILTARRINGSLILQVRRKAATAQTDEEVRFEARTRLRLKQLYGDRYRFQVSDSVQGERLLSLEIPFVRMDPVPAEGLVV